MPARLRRKKIIPEAARTFGRSLILITSQRRAERASEPESQAWLIPQASALPIGGALAAVATHTHTHSLARPPARSLAESSPRACRLLAVALQQVGVAIWQRSPALIELRCSSRGRTDKQRAGSRRRSRWLLLCFFARNADSVQSCVQLNKYFLVVHILRVRQSATQQTGTRMRRPFLRSVANFKRFVSAGSFVGVFSLARSLSRSLFVLFSCVQISRMRGGSLASNANGRHTRSHDNRLHLLRNPANLNARKWLPKICTSRRHHLSSRLVSGAVCRLLLAAAPERRLHTNAPKLQSLAVRAI